MASISTADSPLETRLTAVRSILHDPDAAKSFSDAVHSLPVADADPSSIILQAIQDLQRAGKLTPSQVSSLELANNIAKISNDNLSLIKAIDADQEVNALRDFAVRYETAAIAKQINSATQGASKEDEEVAATIRKKLFEAEPTATIQGLVENDQIPLQDPSLKTNVLSVLGSKSKFDIATTPITSAILADQNILADVPEASS